MKNVVLIFALFFAMNLFAQSTHTIDFEPGGTGSEWEWIVTENADNPPLEFVANPDASGINTGATVAQFIVRAGGNPWALTFTDDNGIFTFDADNAIVKIMVHKPNISNVAIKFEGIGPVIEIPVANTLIDEWEELTYDFSAAIGSSFSRMVVIPDFTFDPRPGDRMVYLDNIQVPEGALLPPPAEPTDAPPVPTHAAENVLSIYSEAYTNLAGTDFNPNWGQSTAVTVDYNAAGNNTLRYQNLNYQGTQFAGGQDVSEYEFIHVDFWTANSTVLNFYLISPGNEIGYSLPITPETWVSVDIELADFVPPVNLSDVFQFKVDGNGTVFFDNWYFWKASYDPATDASLSDLMVDDATVPGFSPETFSYDVVLPIGTTEVPEVTAETTVEEASAEIIPAAALPGTTQVIVTAQDGETQQTYSVNFSIAPEVPVSEYCETLVYHFGIIDIPQSAIYLTIKNLDAQSVFVEIESATESPVDDLILNVPAGVGLSGNDFSVPGKISNTMIWNDTPPAEFEMNVLWSFEDFEGNWQLSETPITVPFAAICEPAGPAMITFRVDMSEFGGTYNNVYVSGSFNDWSGEANPMSDPDMDGVYETTIELENGAYEYKFTLDNWNIQEEFSGDEPCIVTNNGFHNRALEVSGSEVLPAYCWNSCNECGFVPDIFDVTFSVDMSEFEGSYDNVYLNGNFNGWCGDCTQMFDPDMDGVYEVTIELASGAYEYKFTLDGWSQQEMFSGGEFCTVTNSGFTNRFVEISETTEIPTVCWNSCYACGEGPQPKDINFRVDMSQFGGQFNNVFVSGSFNGWCGDCNPLADPDGDMIYSGVLSLNPGEYQFKFTLDNWAVQEEFIPGDPCTITLDGYTNRYLLVEEEAVLDIVCWNSCDACPKYKAGWQGISSNVIPENPALGEVFAPVLDDMTIMLSNNGIFWPAFNINTIGNWDTYNGYKVKFINGVDFEFGGAALDDRTVTFDPGISYVPVLSEGPASVNDLIVPLGTAIDFMFDLTNGLIYWPDGGILPGNTVGLETLHPGFAYLTKFNQTTTIDFSNPMPLPKSAGITINQPTAPALWNEVAFTGIQHIISIQANELMAGDYVGVFDADGTCSGYAFYDGNSDVLPLVVYANDITTETKDGMAEAEAMTFRILRDGAELDVTAVYDQSIANHDGNFAENGLSIVTELKMGTTGLDATNVSSFTIYPNPANGIFNIAPNGEGNFDVTVTNITGQQVLATTINGTTAISLEGQPKGVYFISLANSSTSIVKKIIIE
jgi:hypothetical protein